MSFVSVISVTNLVGAAAVLLRLPATAPRHCQSSPVRPGPRAQLLTSCHSVESDQESRRGAERVSSVRYSGSGPSVRPTSLESRPSPSKALRQPSLLRESDVGRQRASLFDPKATRRDREGEKPGTPYTPQGELPKASEWAAAVAALAGKEKQQWVKGR